ncbi:MAG: HIT family protein [Pirellulaceae bacterium]|nr:HIT family protein [Pirellulaceae bacterium]
MNEYENGCPFCDLRPDRIIAENGLAFALLDKYPVSPGHLLVCPRRHVASFFDLTLAEMTAIFDLVREARSRCDVEFRPAGYNVGANVGHAAGQTVMHVHVHLIPRYDGDVQDPTGGVRNVIPGKGNYLGFGVAEPTP